MISDLIPEDITNMILAVFAENIKDPEMDEILPPKFVRRAIMADKGITGPIGEAELELARDWCRQQADAQERAMKVSHELGKVEPLTQEMAMKGELPRWAVEKWAVTLLLDWSPNLADAVVSAEEYLDNRTVKW